MSCELEHDLHQEPSRRHLPGVPMEKTINVALVKLARGSTTCPLCGKVFLQSRIVSGRVPNIFKAATRCVGFLSLKVKVYLLQDLVMEPPHFTFLAVWSI